MATKQAFIVPVIFGGSLDAGLSTLAGTTENTAANELVDNDELTAAVAAEATARQEADALLAPLASPALTGTPTAPTAASGTDTTQIATTAFVQSEVASKFVKIAGPRGSLAGYAASEAVTAASTTEGEGAEAVETPAAVTVTKASRDYIEIATSGAVTLTFTPASAGEAATKVIKLTASASTTLTVSGASWANGASAPTWGTSGAVLIIVASFLGTSVILSVFHNSEA
jgi:hypothetical protein